MTTRAVVFGDQSRPEIREVSRPRPEEDEILVRVRTVGLDNTTAAAASGRDGRPLLRCGYAGTVEEVGSRVTKELKEGDRVAGVVVPRGPANGGVILAEYVTVKGDLQMAIPDDLGDEEAAALGGPLSMVCQALYGALQLPLPPASWFASQSLLIHGADTPAGRLGIQFARRSGLRVLVTRVGGGGRSNTRAGGEEDNSNNNNNNNKDDDEKEEEEEEEEETLRALGAAAVFDATTTAAAEIRARAGDHGLTLAWDCTGGAGAALCAAALSSTGSGVYYATTPAIHAAASARDDVVDPAAAAAVVPREWPAAVAAAVGARVYAHDDADADDAEVAEEARELARGFWMCAETLLGSGDLTALAVNRGSGGGGGGGAGLEGVLRGLEAGRGEGGSLLVYTL